MVRSTFSMFVHAPNAFRIVLVQKNRPIFSLICAYAWLRHPVPNPCTAQKESSQSMASWSLCWYVHKSMSKQGVQPLHATLFFYMTVNYDYYNYNELKNNIIQTQVAYISMAQKIQLFPKLTVVSILHFCISSLKVLIVICYIQLYSYTPSLLSN